MPQTSKEKVLAFLRELKAVANQSGIHLVNREVNKQSLIYFGLNKKNFETEIMGLTLADYCDGPEPDRDHPGDVWMFGRKISKHEVYIKLKIAQVGNQKIVKCISFHPADHPLNFPFK